MSTPSVPDTWELGSPYERYVGRWSRRVAPLFLSWLGIADGKRWIDVGCGTGALCAAIAGRSAPASVVGVEPSAGFRALAAQSLGAGVQLLEGHAARLPLPDGAADVVVSGLVLNFVPDLSAALAEMRRVTAPGGTIAAYVWDYAGGMEMIRLFWDAACALDPEAARLHEGVRFPLCHPEALESRFRTARLLRPQTTAIDVPTPFGSFEDYWGSFLGGQGPAPTYVATLAEDAREQLRERLRAQLQPRPDGSLGLGARAWAVRAGVG